MPGLGYAVTQVGALQNTKPNIPTDESVGGILFDLFGFDNPFSQYPTLMNNFGAQQIHLVNNMEEAEELGIVEGFMSGLVYYHLSMFYDYIGGDTPLYIAFVDCSSGWDFIEYMQRMTGGRLFQLGIWTTQPLWKTRPNGTTELTALISNVEDALEEVNGVIGEKSATQTPLNVILSPDTNVSISNLKKLPNAIPLNTPKISVLLCQDGSTNVLEIQSKLPSNTPVGSVGIALAILSIAGAEESIGAVAKFNLNKNDKFQNPEIAIGDNHFLLENINRTTLNLLASYGYIIPVTYDSKEGECFYNGDTTLSDGDYSTIANNRVMHKCRRALFNALLPYINSNTLYEDALSGLSTVATQILEEAIGASLTGTLINKEGQYQIGGYQITVIEGKNILQDDTVSIKYSVNPINYNEIITDSVIIAE